MFALVALHPLNARVLVAVVAEVGLQIRSLRAGLISELCLTPGASSGLATTLSSCHCPRRAGKWGFES